MLGPPHRPPALAVIPSEAEESRESQTHLDRLTLSATNPVTR